MNTTITNKYQHHLFKTLHRKTTTKLAKFESHTRKRRLLGGMRLDLINGLLLSGSVTFRMSFCEIEGQFISRRDVRDDESRSGSLRDRSVRGVKTKRSPFNLTWIRRIELVG